MPTDPLDTPITVNELFAAAKELGVDGTDWFQDRYGTPHSPQVTESRTIKQLMASAVYYPMVNAHLRGGVQAPNDDQKASAAFIGALASHKGVTDDAIQTEWQRQMEKWDDYFAKRRKRGASPDMN